MMEKVRIARVSNGKTSFETDIVAREVKVIIKCNTYSLETYASPDMYEELAIGNIASTGMIHAFGDIISIDVNESENDISIDVKINESTVPKSINRNDGENAPSYEIIDTITQKVTKNAKYFDMTGAFHYAYLFDRNGELRFSACDIGRFNAIDKVCGSAIKQGESVGSYILFTTGRIVGRTVDKADALNIRTIVSKAPALYESILKAHEKHIVVIGFSRNSRYIHY